MARRKRSVGYCENARCEDRLKGVFLLDHGSEFYCPDCRQSGTLETERGFHTGNANHFQEVRVEFDFDPAQRVYLSIAIVRIDNAPTPGNVYTLQSPLVRTVAEQPSSARAFFLI